MRIAIVYDCLFPHTVGGAERWYRTLAERLSEGHDVTYLTRRQWSRGEGPETPFATVAVAPGGPLYTRSGRRRIWPTLRFGAGVFWHLVRNARRYDVVHSASFPYFSVIGIWLALRLRRASRLVVDWHELWTRSYWIDYVGALAGRLGYAVQRLCARLPDRSFTFSRLHAARLAEQGHRAPLVRLTGEYASDDGEGPSGGEAASRAEGAREPVVVFAGRHIPEKRVTLVADAIAAARRGGASELRCVVFGDGPERPALEARVRELDLEDAIEIAGRVPAPRVRSALAGACCLLAPSRREGYGLVVVEAAARGTPTILVEGPDNAATELVEQGVNGLVVAAPDPDLIGAAIVEAVERGEALRRTTLEWYRRHAAELSIEASLEQVERAYGELAGS